MPPTPPAPAHPANAAVSPFRLLRARGRALGAPGALGLALAIAVLYAAFAGGATALPEESRLQIAVAAISLAAVGSLLFGRALRLAADPPAYAGVALLAVLAAWTGITLAWSITPDLTWVELNRAIAYALVAGLGLVLGASLPRPLERAALCYLAIAVLVALYALGGKLLPEVRIGGLLDLDHTAIFSRLRAPLGYWNALSLLCALAVPAALRLAADPGRSLRPRLAGLAATTLLLVTVSLTYSRGGFAALALGVAILIAASPDRIRLAAFAAIGAAGAVPALAVAFLRDDLTTDALPASARSDDGLIMLAALVLGLLAAGALALLLARRDRHLRLSPRGARVVRRALLGAAAAVVLLGGAAVALSDRGLGGTISDRWDSFASTKYDPQNDPGRILRINSGNRWVWWNEAGGAWWERPVAGHGAGSFPLVHLQFRENELEVRQPHSVPLEFLAETGLVGALLLLGGLGALGWAAQSRLRSAPPGRERAYGAALAAAAAGWALHLWVDWDWDIPALTIPALIFLGLLAGAPVGRRRARAADDTTPGAAHVASRSATTRDARDLPKSSVSPAPHVASAPRASRPPAARALLLAFAAAVASATAVSAFLPARAEERTSDALESGSKRSAAALEKAANDAEAAARLNPLSAEPLFAGASVAERRRRYATAARLLAQAAERQPADPRVWTRLARFELLIGDVPAALGSLRTLLSLDPHSNLGQFFATVADASHDSATATGTPLPPAAPPASP